MGLGPHKNFGGLDISGFPCHSIELQVTFVVNQDLAIVIAISTYHECFSVIQFSKELLQYST